MELNGRLLTLPKELKLLIGTFVVVLSIGFYSGLFFVNETSGTQPSGIEEQYLGNEDQEEVVQMKFKKSSREMLSMVHGHVLSMALIFFLTGIILSITKLSRKLKLFLMIEPFISVVLTFGGLYLLWTGMVWMKYVVIFSGTLMTLSYTAAVIIIMSQLVRNQTN